MKGTRLALRAAAMAALAVWPGVAFAHTQHMVFAVFGFLYGLSAFAVFSVLWVWAAPKGSRALAALQMLVAAPLWAVLYFGTFVKYERALGAHEALWTFSWPTLLLMAGLYRRARRPSS